VRAGTTSAPLRAETGLPKGDTASYRPDDVSDGEWIRGRMASFLMARSRIEPGRLSPNHASLTVSRHADRQRLLDDARRSLTTALGQDLDPADHGMAALFMAYVWLAKSRRTTSGATWPRRTTWS